MRPFSSSDVGVVEKMKDTSYRKNFFRKFTEDEIASQIRALIERRKHRQIDFARLAGMKPSVVSRLLQPEYSGWRLKTLLRFAEVLDARLRIVFEPAEDVIREYEQFEIELLKQRFSSAPKPQIEDDEQVTGRTIPSEFLQSHLKQMEDDLRSGRLPKPRWGSIVTSHGEGN